MSAYDPKRTLSPYISMEYLEVRARTRNLRTASSILNVRFGSKADIQRYPLQCPLLGAKRTLNRPANHDLHTTVRDDPCDEAFIVRDEYVSQCLQ